MVSSTGKIVELDAGSVTNTSQVSRAPTNECHGNRERKGVWAPQENGW